MELLSSYELYIQLIDQLKLNNRRLLTNCLLDECTIQKYISDKRFYYDYSKDNYLNIFLLKNDYYYLYFYVANENNYSVNNDNTIYTEIFESKDSDKYQILINKLTDSDFKYHSTFHKYVCHDFISQNIDNQNFYLEEGPNQEAYDLLFEIFDKYTDYLPIDESFEEYHQKEKCLSIYSKDKELAGALFYKVEGNVATCDYIYVLDKYKGNKLSYILYEGYLKKEKENVKSYISWIRDDNVRSYSRDLKLGFIQQKSKKTTFIKNNKV